MGRVLVGHDEPSEGVSLVAIRQQQSPAGAALYKKGRKPREQRFFCVLLEVFCGPARMVFLVERLDRSGYGEVLA
jgi:hypothetical protein